jgi:RNA polymerase sigma-70 factor (ECF subfamily)
MSPFHERSTLTVQTDEHLMRQTLSDLELVRGLQARSAAAFSRVYDDYHAGIYNLCARILDDREEAQDVTQDVFIKAFSSPPAAVGEVKLKAWLYRVATNACFNVLRGRRHSGGLAEADDVPAAGDAYEQSQSAALIEQSLARLNERYRAALVLKDLHGFGGDELAEVLEVSRPAADVLVHRARASFKKTFAGLAGEGFVAPANLVLALPLLSVPAALQALPLLPAALAPPHAAAAPGPAVPGLDPSSIAGPAGPGLLAKLAAAAGTKAAIVVGGAAVIVGGGLVIRESRRDEVASGRAGGEATATLVAATSHRSGDAHDKGYGGAHDSWAEHRHAVAEHLSHSEHSGAHHSTSGGHASDGHAGQAAHDGDHASSAAAAHGGDAYVAGASSTGSTGTASDHHSDSGDASTTHDAAGER